MKRYETMTTKEIMDAFNSPSICKDDSCADCFIYKERLNGNIKENICGAGAGTCSNIIRRYLNEETSRKNSIPWHYIADNDYPTMESKVIIGYCDESGDHVNYYTDVATFYKIQATPIWIVDNDILHHHVECWIDLPEYNGEKNENN